MDKAARPSALSNRCPTPFSVLPAGAKMLAGYWMLVLKSGTSKVRQSTNDICSRNCACALETSVTRMMPARHRENHRMKPRPAFAEKIRHKTSCWFPRLHNRLVGRSGPTNPKIGGGGDEPSTIDPIIAGLLKRLAF
jgi:hypothetical protein